MVKDVLQGVAVAVWEIIWEARVVLFLVGVTWWSTRGLPPAVADHRWLRTLGAALFLVHCDLSALRSKVRNLEAPGEFARRIQERVRQNRKAP